MKAAERQRARVLYDEAEKLVQATRWADALAKLEALTAVHKATETPVVVFYIALCKANLGRLRESLQDYKKARALLAADARFPAKERAALEEKLGVGATDLEARLPKVTVRLEPGDPAAGELHLTLDGAEVDAALLVDKPFALDPGDHKLGAEAPARKPVERAFALREGQALDVPLGFAPVAVPKPPPAKKPPPPPPPPPSGLQKTLGYVVLGLGGAALVAGGTHVTLDRFVGNDKENADLVTLGLGGGGLVGVGVGIVLLATAPSAPRAPRAGFAGPATAAPPGLRWGAGPARGGGASLWVGGSF